MNASHSVAACPRAKRRGFAWCALWVALWTIGAVRPACAVNFVLEGRTPQRAWSGYWWPMLATRGWHLYDETGPFTPLVKYGQVTGDLGPLRWEQSYQRTTDPGATWWGHCNGWAASVVLEPAEPRRPVQVGAVTFNVGEIKGLLAACHQGDPVDFFSGQPRTRGADSRTDLRAKEMHRAVLYYLRDRKEMLIFNVSSKPEVWNYPAYAFRMRGVTDRYNPDVTHITLTLAFADDEVVPHFVGTRWFLRTYTYWVQGDPSATNGVIAAEWTGDSVHYHPQFVWHPAFARPHNPELGEPPSGLDVEWVQRLAQNAAYAP